MPPGTTENGQTGTADGVTHGTADAALIAAAQASSSDAGSSAGHAEDTSGQSSTGTAGTTAAATGQTGQTGSSGSQAGGDAPQHRIEAAVRNAREETRREVESQYSAFKGMNAEEATLAMQLLKDLRGDPQQFYRDLAERLKSAGGGSDEAIEDYPEADLVSGDGKLRTYSHAAHLKALDIHAKRVTADIMKRVAPFMKYAETAQGRDEQAAAQAAEVGRIDATLSSLRQQAHFKNNETGILEVLKAMPKEERAELGPVMALHVAYTRFLNEKLLPGFETAAEKRVREQNARKANSSTGSAHPADQGGEAGKPVLKNERDLAAHMAHLAESAAG